jgi:hypothetical protein
MVRIATSLCTGRETNGRDNNGQEKDIRAKDIMPFNQIIFQKDIRKLMVENFHLLLVVHASSYYFLAEIFELEN